MLYYILMGDQGIAMKSIKNIAVFGFCFFLLLGAFTMPAGAQEAATADDPDDAVSAAPPVGQQGFPDFASHVEVATIFHKLTGQAPNFEQWAKLSPECQAEKTQTGRITCVENKQAELRQKYQLQTLNESIPVPFVPAIFSAYSKENQGYVVKNFTEETYLPFTYAGRNYAIIPQGLMDRQFLPITGPAQKDVENALRGAQRKAVVLLYIKPTFADKNAMPVELDGKQYTLISGQVTNIGVYKCRKNQPCTLLWEEGSQESRDAQRDDLMNLKR